MACPCRALLALFSLSLLWFVSRRVGRGAGGAAALAAGGAACVPGASLAGSSSPGFSGRGAARLAFDALSGRLLLQLLAGRPA
jgi:hypothetical protein